MILIFLGYSSLPQGLYQMKKASRWKKNPILHKITFLPQCLRAVSLAPKFKLLTYHVLIPNWVTGWPLKISIHHMTVFHTYRYSFRGWSFLLVHLWLGMLILHYYITWPLIYVSMPTWHCYVIGTYRSTLVC